jgi:hypothetical protein
MMNTYSIRRQTWKWTKKTFFTYWTWQYLTATFSLPLVERKWSHRDFQFCLVRDLLKESGRALQTGTEIPTLPTSWLNARHTVHCPRKGMWWRCPVFHKKEAQKLILQMCEVLCGVVYCAMFLP